MVKTDIPKPNFIIIGSAKCGTTTLARILSDHPDCCSSRPREVSFFCADDNYSQGWEWYQQNFSHYSDEQLIGEATPAYSNRMAFPKTAERIYGFNPEMKLIYIVRDPYQKLTSMWKMNHRREILEADAQQSFVNRKNSESLLFLKEEKYSENKMLDFNRFFDGILLNQNISTCFFNYQIEAYLRFFKKDQIHVIFLEDMKKDIKAEMEKVCLFLDLDVSKNVIFNSRGENRSDTFQKESFFWRTLRQSRFKPLLAGALPSSMKKVAYNMMGRKKYLMPSADLSSDRQQKFFELVREDAELFLQRYGKSSDFWPSISNSLMGES